MSEKELSIRAKLNLGVATDYVALTKPRLVLMVILSVLVGYLLAPSVSRAPLAAIAAVLATTFVAAGAMVLNQFLERDVDAKMLRTQNRPLPSGRCEPVQAFVFGLVISAIGFLLYLLWVNPMSLFFSFLTWASYLFVYTPLKRKTSLSTIAGAFPGALPPVIGWTAAGAPLGIQPLVLFLIIFFWQVPHFLAIAWIYRDDYERARLPVLSVVDREGAFVARQMILNMCALMPVSLLPTLFGLTGFVYFFGAFALGLCFSSVIIYSAADLELRARYVLRASIVYLAALLLLMVIDRI